MGLVHFQRLSWEPGGALRHPLDTQSTHLFSTRVNNSEHARKECSGRFLLVVPVSRLLQPYTFVLLLFQHFLTLSFPLAPPCFSARYLRLLLFLQILCCPAPAACQAFGVISFYPTTIILAPCAVPVCESSFCIVW